MVISPKESLNLDRATRHHPSGDQNKSHKIPMEPLTNLETLKPRAKAVIYFAFVFSIILYAIVFHMFKLSPSDLINNTKFWFLVSNTLIIIIAADYGAFLSSSSSSSSSSSFSSSSADLCEEYAMIRRQRSAFSVRTRFPMFANPSIPEENQTIHQVDHHHCRPHEVHPIDDLPDKLQLAPEKNRDATSEFDLRSHVPDRRTLSQRKIRRSQSDISKKRVVFDESKNVVRLIECEEDDKQQRAWECCKADEYSRLSDEELNQRVEDFINRTNNQIRFQKDVYC